MDLLQALKAGIVPVTANPVEIILVAHKEGLHEILQKQIIRHHNTLQKSNNPEEARKWFRLTCDFTEIEKSSMVTDLKLWNNVDNEGPTKNMGGNSDGFLPILKGEMTNDMEMIASLYVTDKATVSPLGILKSLRRKKLYKPVDDRTVTACYKCGSPFDSYLSWIKSGKHHCRACGRIFCHNCTQWKELIPNDVISYVDYKGWITDGQASRVCQVCKDVIGNFRRIEYILHYFEIVAYPIDLCVKASTLSRDWREAMRFYLSNVRDIQYCLPSTQLSERDIRALNSNMKSLQGHNKWILQALKTGLITINGKRIRMCHDMMCDRNCTEHLSPLDALIILNTPIYSVEVRLLALQILEKDRLLRRSDSSYNEDIYPHCRDMNSEIKLSDVNDDLISIVNGLELSDRDFKNINNNELLENKTSFSRDIALFLPAEDLSVQEFILKCPDLFLDFFWLSRINSGISTDIFRNKLLLANLSEANYVQESLRLISLLDSHQDNLCELSQQLQTLRVPFAGPFGVIEKFDHEVTAKTSATRPIIIRYYSGGEKRAFLYKREDVRKDAHIVALIRIMYYLCSDIFSHRPHSQNSPVNNTCSSSPINISTASEDIQKWFTRSSPISFSPPFPSYLQSSTESVNRNFSHSTESSLEFFNSLQISGSDSDNSGILATYRVMPVSTNSGFIEIVPHAATLFDILNEGTISNYLYRPHEGGDVSVIGSNYLNSLAFWTVTSYLLGVGDRHLENIMIRKDGILFHIDYGFVFGADSTTSLLRLDRNLIEGLGGIKMYEPFKTRCCEIYSCLRRHFNLICSCLLRLSSIQPPITGYKFTPDFIEKFVVERFLYGQTEEEAKEAFSHIIDSNRETLLHKVSDAIHSTVSSFKVGGWFSY